ncbi:ATP-dependent DNA helicase PIF1-like protein [Tanacetum coccineum]
MSRLTHPHKASYSLIIIYHRELKQWSNARPWLLFLAALLGLRNSTLVVYYTENVILHTKTRFLSLAFIVSEIRLYTSYGDKWIRCAYGLLESSGYVRSGIDHYAFLVLSWCSYAVSSLLDTAYSSNFQNSSNIFVLVPELRLFALKDQGTTLLREDRLFQQYLVDAYTAIEEQRVSRTRNNQDTLRVDLYHNVCDAIIRGDTNAAGLGKRIVLSDTFTGGLRYMM